MKKIIYIAFLLSPLLGQAQDLDQNVKGTAGNYSESGTASLNWTIGETVVETVSDGTNTLTQGFHQGNLSVTTLIEKTELISNLKVYPNPVENILHVETDKIGVDYQLLNINGQAVSNGKLENKNNEVKFSDLPAGTYFLKINNQKTHKIIKH
ncbi:MAG: T9SS type A sorting domain-containing protein [Cyclobacteriaceae bacterium]